jgi:GNAT superfamily N-acetyltransferase
MHGVTTMGGMGGTDTTGDIVEAGEFDQPTLQRFCAEVLLPSFPAAEMMTLDEVLEAYLGADPEVGALLVADGEPVAGILAERYATSGVLLIGYVAVHRSRRGRGDGMRLVTTMLPRWQDSLRPSLVIAEIDDPRFHATDIDTGDPASRLRFWERAGWRLLAMPYFQPSLRAGSPRARDMLLITFGIDGHEVPGEIIASFLREYFVGCEGESALSDPDVLGLLDWTRRDSGRVALWPLNRFPDLPASFWPELSRGEPHGRRSVPYQSSARRRQGGVRKGIGADG